MRFVNSWRYCSGGLREILERRGIAGNFFTLPIKKGRIFKIIFKLRPNGIIIFHIGCSTDDREPSIEIWERKECADGHNSFSFGFERIIPIGIVNANNWFHDARRKRDLEKTVKAFDNWGACEEIVSFSCNTADGNMGRSVNVHLRFKAGLLQEISDIEDLRETPFISRLVGFKGAALDQFINRAKNLEMKKDYLTPKDWNRLLSSQNMTIESLITELYNLYLRSSKGMTLQPYHPR